MVSGLLTDAEAVEQRHEEGGEAGGQDDDADVPGKKVGH